MGCAQAKQSHPNKHLHNNHQKTNRLPGQDSPQKGQILKKKQAEIKGKEQAKLVIEKKQNPKPNDQNQRPTPRQENTKVLNKSIQEKKSQTRLQQPPDDKTKTQKGIAINVNLAQSGTLPNQSNLINQGLIQEGQNMITENQNQQSCSTINFKKSKGTVKQIDISEELKRNYRVFKEDYVDDIRPEAEQKVQDHKKKQNQESRNGKLNQTTGQSNKNFSQKRINEISSKQPLTDNNLFYSQLKTSNNNKTAKEQDQSQKQNRGTQQKKKTSQDGSYFGEIKDEKISRNQLGKKNDHSLKYEKSGKVGGFNKKSEYQSVLQNKKGFEDRFKSSGNEKANQTMDDLLIQDNDQQGTVRAPLETSYHPPSKRTIQSSKRSISSSNSRQTQKYIEQLPNSPITEGVELEMENQFSEKAMSSQHQKQMNKFQTAFFKDPSKNALQVTRENVITADEENILQQQHNLTSDISFRQKQDSQEVPEQGDYANSLQISVHLTMANHF